MNWNISLNIIFSIISPSSMPLQEVSLTQIECFVHKALLGHLDGAVRSIYSMEKAIVKK